MNEKQRTRFIRNAIYWVLFFVFVLGSTIIMAIPALAEMCRVIMVFEVFFIGLFFGWKAGLMDNALFVPKRREK